MTNQTDKTAELLTQLTERVAHLEKRGKRAVVAVWILGALLLTIVTLGAVQKQADVRDVIRTERLEILGDKGNVVAEMHYDPAYETAMLTFNHSNGLGTTILSSHGLDISSNSEDLDLSLSYYPEWDAGPSLTLFGSTKFIAVKADDEQYGTNIVLTERNFGEDIAELPTGCTVKWECP
jgi:hypothetical protein